MPRKRQLTRVIQPSRIAQSAAELSRPITMLCRNIAANNQVQSHSHPWGQLIYADSGVLSVKTNSNHCIVPAEQAVWVPPFLEHEVTALSEVNLSSLYVVPSQSDGLPTTCSVLNIDPLTSQLIRKARGIRDNYPREGKESRLLRVILDCVTECREVTLNLPLPHDRRLIHIVDSIQLQVLDNRSLNDWGAIVGASPRTLSRKFKQETGITFSEWMQRLKIQRAISLLNKGMPVTNVSIELGYESSSAFIFMFRQHLGESPGKYLSNS